MSALLASPGEDSMQRSRGDHEARPWPQEPLRGEPVLHQKQEVRCVPPTGQEDACSPDCLCVICPAGSLLILKDIEVRTFGEPSRRHGARCAQWRGEGLCPKGFGAVLSLGLCVETEGSPSQGRWVQGGQPWLLHPVPGPAAQLPRRARTAEGCLAQWLCIQL